MRRTKGLLATMALMLVFSVSGCESVKEKAESHYQKSLELVQAGDVDRALVELKAVFSLNSQHRDARMLYAKLKVDRNEIQEAYGHLMLVVEEFPDDVEAQALLGELALKGGALDEAQRHAYIAEKLKPEDLKIQSIATAVRYAIAKRDGDNATMEAQFTRAQELLAVDPSNTYIRRVVVDRLAAESKLSAALASVDEALALAPLDTDMNQMKLTILSQQSDLPGLGAHLKTMVERFPENKEVRTALVRWYLAQGDRDGAEAYVRSLVAKAGNEIPPRVTLVQFLKEVRGNDVALAELDKLITEGLDDQTFKLMRATLLFDSGDHAAAIAQVNDMLVGQSASDKVRTSQVTLARMLTLDGQKDKAKELVEHVLSQDAKEVGALKLKADWLIEQDEVRDAVLALRTAQDQSPNDPEIMTLLARAYERGGNRELMAESLALAYEASQFGPEETLRYANYLFVTDKMLTAEEVLLKGLRMAPSNVPILAKLGDVYLALNDLPRAQQVADALTAMNTEETLNIAAALKSTLLQRSERNQESIDFLQAMVNKGEGGLAAQAAIIRAHLANGEIRDARLFMDELLAKHTETDAQATSELNFLNAALLATEGKFDEAAVVYRSLLQEDPKNEAVWRALIATTERGHDSVAAEAVLEEALTAMPGSPNLMWVKAGYAEKQGRIDDAIAIYEQLYTADSNSPIVANNLASLITTYRDDDASQQRAFVIARRLRGTKIPAFQETYGWISYRLGNYAEALEYLEPAAKGLQDDPTVHYHLAKTYVALNRPADAVPNYERALELWGTANFPMVDDARTELAKAQAAPASVPLAQ